MIDREWHNVLGIKIDAVDYDAAVQRIIEAAKNSRPFAVSALAVHGVMTGVLDPEHRYRLNHLDLVVPDGQPVRWALNWLHGAGLADRVYGPRLMLETCQQAADHALPIFLYGDTEDVIQRLQQELTKRFPSLRIAGTSPSKFRRMTSSEKDQTVRAIRDSGAAITFVGLGCPRQEVWAYEFRELLSMPVLAVGAAFSFHAGLIPQAPPTPPAVRTGMVLPPGSGTAEVVEALPVAQSGLSQPASAPDDAATDLRYRQCEATAA